MRSGEPVRPAPRLSRERRLDRHGDGEGIAERAGESVHERGVLVPTVLFAPPPAVIPGRPLAALDEEVIRHVSEYGGWA